MIAGNSLKSRCRTRRYRDRVSPSVGRSVAGAISIIGLCVGSAAPAQAQEAGPPPDGGTAAGTTTGATEAKPLGSTVVPDAPPHEPASAAPAKSGAADPVAPAPD